jgi:hypothetical protein
MHLDAGPVGIGTYASDVPCYAHEPPAQRIGARPTARAVDKRSSPGPLVGLVVHVASD